jgi:hypothetical protein
MASAFAGAVGGQPAQQPRQSHRGVHMRMLLAVVFVLTSASVAAGQPGVLTREQLIEYTPDWKGERFADGRPKVADSILDRMKLVTL